MEKIYANETPAFIEHIFPDRVNNAGVVVKEKTVRCRSLVSAAELLEDYPLLLEQNLHHYYFDWIHGQPWLGTVLVKRKNLTTPQNLRDYRRHFPRCEDGGYHFSYMGGVDRVINKMTSIVDGNEIVVNYGSHLTDRKHVEESMSAGRDIYGQRERFEPQFLPYDVRNIKLPYLNEFLKKYPYFLREPEKFFARC